MVRRTVLLLFVGLAILSGLARRAHAAPNDKEVEELVQSVFETEYVGQKFQDALDKLELAKQACDGASCSPRVRARVLVAIGTVLAGGLKRIPEAREAFAKALAEDPSAALLPAYLTSDVEQAFGEARGLPAPGSGSPEKKSVVPSPSPPTSPSSSRKPKRAFKGGRAPRGWRSAEAAFYYGEALAAEGARDWAECVAAAQASLASENRPTTRFLAASCEERGGRWLEALAEYAAVAEVAGGPRVGLYDTAREAKARAQALRDKIPKLTIRKPARADELVVKMNDAVVPPEKLGGEIWVNPGQRTISATGKVDGVPLEFEQTIDAGEAESVSVDIKLTPKGAKVSSATVRCFLEAKTRDDFNRCINGGAPPGLTDELTLRVGSELSAYHDTDHVDVVSPALVASVENPTGGWGFGASFLVDVVTAASADIVSTASPRWREVRYVPALNAHKKLGDTDLGVHASLSHEPDYLATAAGASISTDLRQKTITPSLTYEFSHDVSGRSGTPFDVFSRKINRHGVDAATTFVLDKATFFAASFTAVLEDGDTSKPYRYVPMFRAALADRVRPGQSIDSVNASRSPERVLEQLPTSRQRWAVAARIAHRFTQSTIRIEERLYVDSWGLKATTTDARYLYDITQRIRVWPHLRFHGQSAVDFWQLAYVSQGTSSGSKVPALRTGDRELGPLLGATLGAGTRVALGEGSAWGVTLSGDVVYTRFLDHLFILERYGVLGALGLEATFE